MRSQRTELTPPASKSGTLRALVAAALARGTSRLDGALACDDSEALATSMSRLGASVRPGVVWEVDGIGGQLRPGPCDLEAGESGAVLRFLLALTATGNGTYTISVQGRLAERPASELTTVLAALGARIGRTSSGGYRVEAGGVRGSSVSLPRLRSSQTLSALLLAAPCLPDGLRIRTSGPLPSPGYVRLTLQTLADFGVAVTRHGACFDLPAGTYRSARLDIERDWSSASYLLGAGAILERPLALRGLSRVSSQPDRRLVTLLRAMGADVRFEGDALLIDGGLRRHLVADFDRSPDLAPTFAALAALAPGTSHLRGLQRLRDKESDRLRALSDGLSQAGLAHQVTATALRVTGGQPRPGSVLAGCGDHRVVMSFALLSLREPSLTVTDHAAVSKSYPDFFADLARVARG